MPDPKIPPFASDVRQVPSSPARPSNPSGFGAVLSHALAHSAPAPTAIPEPSLAPKMPPTQGSHERENLHERALHLLSKRQELLAANIANADTPNYKAVDIDVAEALRLGYTPENVPIKYRVPSQPSLDGNTVEMDAERAHFAHNTITYRFALDRVSGYYKEMAELLKSLTQ